MINSLDPCPLSTRKINLFQSYATFYFLEYTRFLCEGSPPNKTWILAYQKNILWMTASKVIETRKQSPQLQLTSELVLCSKNTLAFLHLPCWSASPRGETEGKILLDTSKRRLVNKSGELKVLAKNVPRKTRLYLADIFTTMIDLRWKWVIFIFISSYIISWVVFGFIWWLIAYVRGSTICIEKVC